MGIQGRIALVTGAASGMGRATAKLLAAEGAIVALADVNDSAAVAEDIRRSGGKAQVFRFDATSAASIKQLAAAVVSWSGGKLDILVNNAGVGGLVMLTGEDDAYESSWKFNFDVNVTAQQRLTRAVLPQLIASVGSGRVVNISSTEGLGATIFNSPYAAAKHASIGLTKAMAVELASQGVTVNAICPGPIRTAMTGAIPEHQKELFAKRLVPMRRYGAPEEVAYMTLSLVDDRASFTNGSVVPVDGGILANNALLPMRLPWEPRKSKL